jgi:putative ubiquitin-RnfH superfamily antitoxin RatB of RatAB toxin-antitoxin module
MVNDPPGIVVDQIEVIVALAVAPRQVTEVKVKLPEGATAARAIAASGLLANAPDAHVDTLALAIWGKKVVPTHVLRQGDRLELLSTLRVDPKVARRERFARQGSKAAGLFAQDRGVRPPRR